MVEFFSISQLKIIIFGQESGYMKVKVWNLSYLTKSLQLDFQVKQANLGNNILFQIIGIIIGIKPILLFVNF